MRGLVAQRLEQVRAFFRVVQARRELVEVEQHGAQHVEEVLRVVLGAALDHGQDGREDGGDADVFIADEADAGVFHGNSRWVRHRAPTADVWASILETGGRPDLDLTQARHPPSLRVFLRHPRDLVRTA